MSSSTYRIHGARYLRKYTAADKSSSYAYMADVRKIADTLCKVPWTRVSGDIQATMTLHTEEGLDWNEPERDRFDAAEWCADHSDGMHRAFAQAACYVFELPTSAIGTAIEKIGVTVTSDPYNPYGARISALTSDTLTIPMDCATVRTGDIFNAPDEDGMGAAPRLYVTNSDGSQTWYANTETVELEPATGVTLAAKKYLFVFVCLENYNRGRDGWIEGSSYIENDVSLTLADACADLVAAELNDCSPVRVPTTLKLVNLATKATDATITLSGPVHSMLPISPLPDSDAPNGTDGCQYAVITGDFDEYSVSGMPGFVVYDFANRAIATVSEEVGHEIPATVKAAWRLPGVKAKLAGASSIEPMCDYAPANCFAKSYILLLEDATGALSAEYTGAASVDFTPTAEVADISIMHNGDSLFSFYQDRIEVAQKRSDGIRLPLRQFPFSGQVTHIGSSIYGSADGSFLVAGSNRIGDNAAAVKLLTPNGQVLDFFVDLTPDNFEDFSANEFIAGGVGIIIVFGSSPTTSTPFASPRGGCDYYTDESSGYHLVAKYDPDAQDHVKPNATIIKIAQSPGFIIAGTVGLLLTGRFKSIGGLRANGAAVLVYCLEDTTKDSQMSLVPLDVGPIKHGVVFADDDSPLPIHISHMLIEPVS